MPGKGKMASSGLTSLLTELRLTKQTTNLAQLIETLPAKDLGKALGRLAEVKEPKRSSESLR